MVRMIICFWFL